MDKLMNKGKSRKVQFENMKATLGFLGEQQAQADLLKASKMRSLMNSYNFIEAYKEKSKVAFTGEEFPHELLFALGIIPLNLQTTTALFSRSDSLNRFISLADEFYLSRDICSNVRCSLGIGLADCLPRPDIVLGNSAPCDGFSKLAYIVSKLYKCKFFILNTPAFINDDSISYLERQMKEVINEISIALNIKFKQENLIETIEYSNKAKEYFCKTTRLCRKARLPGVLRELFEFIVSNPWGKKELVSISRTLYEDAYAESQKKENQKNGKRVLWIGQVPNYSHGLIEYIEKEVEVLYMGCLDDSHEIMLDPKEPLKSIAKRSVMYMWDPVRMGNTISTLCKTFEIEGIILLNAWGCRNLLGINHMFKELKRNSDTKFLTIDVDFMDKDKYAFSQLKNRIDAFTEIINGG